MASTTLLLQQQCGKLYKIFERSLHIFRKPYIQGMYDKIQHDKLGNCKQSFVGNMMCGESCLILKYLLEELGHDDVRVFINEQKTEYGPQDHAFLYTRNNVVDPTYRQFMIDIRSKNSQCLYRQTLFNKFDPFMIVNPRDVSNYLKNIIDVNASCYSTPFITYDEIKLHWDFEEDVTSDYDLHKYVYNNKLLIGKPNYYKKLIKYIKHRNLLESDDFNIFKLD